MNWQKAGFALCQVLAWVAIWTAHLVVGGFKGNVTVGEKLLFFLFIGVSCLLAFGSLLLLRGNDRSSNSWVPVIGLVIMGGSAAVITPVLASARAAASHSACLSNVKQLSTAVQIYTADWDDRLPSAPVWQDQLADYTPKNIQIFKCPIGELPFGYGMNREVSGLPLSKIKEPDKTVVIFEAWSQEKNFSGGNQNFVALHGGRGAVGFASGKAVLIQKDNHEVIWKP